MIIISKLVPSNIIDELNRLGISVLKAGKAININNETAYHPDMLFYRYTNNSAVCAIQNDFVHNLDIFKKSVTLKEGYPSDCVLNCFKTNKLLICGKHTDKSIIDDAEEAKLQIIYVKQGYAACSTVRLYNDSFITADEGIYKALKANGCNVLKVSNDGIKLNGYNCGFIGGTVLYANSKFAAFSGKISEHKSFSEIKSFCNNVNIEVCELSSESLYDYGGYFEI